MDDVKAAHTFLSIIATASVLFCTLILIPIQRHAEKFSSKFIKFIVKDWLVVLIGLILSLSFIYNLIFVAWPKNFLGFYYSKIIGFLSLFLSFTAIIVVTFRIAQFFQAKFLLKKMIRKIQRFIRSGKWRVSQQSLQERQRDLMDITREIFVIYKIKTY